MKFWFFLFPTLLLSLLPCHGQEKEKEKEKPAVPGLEITAGGRAIKLPPPPGFERVDGLNPATDRLVDAALPSTNRYLARFEPIGQAASHESPAQDRRFNVQILRSLENREIGAPTFSKVRDSIKKEMDQLSKNIQAEMEKQFGDATDQLKKKTGVDAALSVGNVAMLGYFGETEESLGFSLAINSETRLEEKTSKSKDVAAALVIPVNGRLIYLNASSDYHSEADRQWAEKSLMNWRDSIRGVNSQVEKPPVKNQSAAEPAK